MSNETKKSPLDGATLYRLQFGPKEPVEPDELSRGPMVVFVIFWMFFGVLWGLFLGWLIWG